MNNPFPKLSRLIFYPALGWRALLLASIVGAASVWLLYPHLNEVMVYPEFVVGPHTFSSAGKAADARSFTLFLLVTIGSYLAINSLIAVGISRSKWSIDQYREAVDWMLLPLLPWVGMMVVQPQGWMPYMGLLALASGAILGCIGCWRKAPSAEESIPAEWISLVVGLFVLALFGGLGLAQAVSLLTADTSVGGSMYIRYGMALGPFMVVGLLVASWLMSSSAGRSYTALLRIAMWVQLPLPLLALAVLPSRLVHRGQMMSYDLPLLLSAVITVYVGCSVYGVYRRWQHFQRDPTVSWKSVFSPVALAGIPLFIGAATRRYPIFWSDDFHMGEQLIPWRQWMDFGQTPFVDFAPFHGFMHVISGALNALFFDGTAGHYWDTMNLLFAVTAAVTFWTVYRIAGLRTALFCAVLTLPQGFYMNRMLFLVPAFFLLADASLLNHRLRWLVVWVLISGCMVVYNTVTGANLVLATLPFAAWQAWRLWRSAPKQFYGLSGVLAGIGGLLLVTPLTREIGFGYLQFIVENRVAYEANRAIPWSMGAGQTPYESGLFSNPVVFEFVRFSWIAVLLCALYWLSRQCFSNCRPRIQTVYLLGGTALVLLSFKLYALQRIDPAAEGRTGTLSYIAFALFLPLLLTYVYPLKRLRIYLVLALLAGGMSVFMDFSGRFYIQNLFWETDRVVAVPDDLIKVEGAQIGMPRVGTVFTEAARLERMLRFREALRKVIGPDQTYFDLTNAQSHYFFNARRVPTRYAAQANAGNAIQQERMIRQLMDANPPAVFIHPSVIVDQPVNLRSYYLFRYALLNYAPIEVDSFTFLVNADSPAYPRRMTESAGWDHLANLYPLRHLADLPAGWGRSWSTLKGQARHILSCMPEPVDGTANKWRIDLRDATVAGRDADLVVLQFASLPSEPTEIVEVSWQAADQAVSTGLTMALAYDRLVIPVGAFPAWLLQPGINMLWIDVGSNTRLQSVELWAREEMAISEH